MTHDTAGEGSKASEAAAHKCSLCSPPKVDHPMTSKCGHCEFTAGTRKEMESHYDGHGYTGGRNESTKRPTCLKCGDEIVSWCPKCGRPLRLRG